MNQPDVTPDDIFLARERIAPIVQRTPLINSRFLSERTGTAVRLKLENLQETGSFKLRGATNKLLNLSAGERERGVVTVSTGNHGRAVAYAAGKLGIPAVICLSENVPPNKVEAIRQLGAEVVQAGRSYDEAESHALRLRDARGLTLVDPFDDPLIVAGQGTIGLELLEEMPEIDMAVIPLSGGGLVAGIAIALKSAKPAVRIIGISMDRAPVMVHSLRAGRPIEMPEEPTLADALAGGIGLRNRHTFRLVQELVDETHLVTEEEIAAGMAFAFHQHHVVVEGGGAVGLAALLHGRVPNLGRRIAVVISGGNVDAGRLLQIAQR